MRDDQGYKIRIMRESWDVVYQPVDQYFRDHGTPQIITSWPTFEEATQDLPNHAVEAGHVDGRWYQKTDQNGYVIARVKWRESPINDPQEIAEILRNVQADIENEETLSL